MTLLFDPFAPLFELSREFNRSTHVRSFVPAADVVMTGEDVTVVLDVPGFGPNDLEIELVNDVLTIRGERPVPYSAEDDRRTWQRLERGFGAFERTLRMPKGLDGDGISADMSDGVLTLHIPVVTPKPRRIEISPSQGAQPAIEHDDTGHERGEQRELAGATA